MKKSKGIVIVSVIFALVALPFFSAYSAEKQLPTSTPSKIITQPPQATKPIKPLPDLIVERVWLDDQGFINFQLKNAGQGEIPDGEHQQGVVRVSFGNRYEDFSFTRTIKTKPAVDPKGKLKKSGGVVLYNTGIKVEKRLTIKVVVDSLAKIAEANDQNNQGTLLASALGALKAKGKEVQPVSPEVGREIVQKEKLKPLEGGGPQPPLSASIRVLTPNGGERWYRGGLYRVRWVPGMGDYVHLILLKEGGSVETPYRSQPLPNTGQFDWQIQEEIEPRDDYKIKIISLSGPNVGVQRLVGSDVSDANFSIVNAETREIRVVDPNGGETLYYTLDSVRRGRPFRIRWWSRGIGNQVKIELYNAAPHLAGTLCHTIAERVDNYEDSSMFHGQYTGYYEWWPDINYSPPSHYKIRVSSLGRLNMVYDESDAPFIITEPPPPVTEEVVLPMVEGESGQVFCHYDCRHRTPIYGSYSTIIVGTGYQYDFDCRRGLASFDLTGIPAHATIDEAKLDLSKYSTSSGGSWPNKLGRFEIYQVSYGPLEDAQTNYTLPGVFCGGTAGIPPTSPFNVTHFVGSTHRRGFLRWKIRMQFEIQDPDECTRIGYPGVQFTKVPSGCTLKIRYTYIPYEEGHKESPLPYKPGNIDIEPVVR